MIYKWHVDVTLKNSSVLKRCKYEGKESDAKAVFDAIFVNVEPDCAIGLYCNDDLGATFFIPGSIAAVDIYPKKK